MPDLDAIDEALTANATGPKSVTQDGTNVTQHSPLELLEIQKHAAANAQASSAQRLVFNKISPPGAA